jgi:predicted  nucleic acid-binding Zn-ribbon protein
LNAANEAYTVAVTELEALQQDHDELVIDYTELREHYKAIRERETELGKRLEDGQEAHRDDVAAERHKYEALKAEQDNLVERYQKNKLVC